MSNSFIVHASYRHHKECKHLHIRGIWQPDTLQAVSASTPSAATTKGKGRLIACCCIRCLRCAAWQLLYIKQNNFLFQVAATTLHHRSLQLHPQAVPEGSAQQARQTSEGQLVTQGQAAIALPSPAAGNSPHVGSDRTSKAVAEAAELALKREDAELSQRVASERKHLPSNVEGFK